MARSFDTWLRYQDNSNKPLHGCIQFMVRDGNTSAPIYDQDGQPLDNPQITDVYGRTEHQVFINEDVTAYFYKYIGQGTLEQEQELGIDTNDPSKWSLQYTCENQQSYDTHLTANAATCVPSISALRALDVDSVPLTCDKVEITLLGYNAVGDKEPINYTWASGSTAADNGGSVIKCDDLITGRWIMTQPTEHCDTRHFGAFPQNSYNCPDQSYQIGQCCVYCMLHGLRPFFNGSMDYRWFKYSNMNVVVDAFDVTEDTRFYDAGNNTFQGDWNGNPRFTLGNTNVVGAKNIKTSWNAKSYTGYKNVIIDQQSQQKNWQDAHIDVQISPLFGYNFTHCTFEPNGNLGSDNANQVDNTFNNCKLNEKMFILSGENAANLIDCCTDCQYDIDDFKNALYLWKQIRCTSDASPYFDYRGLAPGLPFSLYQGNKITSTACEVHNMKNPITEFDLLGLGSQLDTIILDDCTGYYAFNARTVYIRNSNIKLAMTASTTFIIENSTVTLDNNVYTSAQPIANAPAISMRNSTLVGQSGVTYNCSMFSAWNSIIHPAINAANTVLKDCQVNGTYSLIPELGTPVTVSYLAHPDTTVSHFIHGYIDNNIFNAKLRIDGAAGATWFIGCTDVLVNSFIFQNNRSNLQNIDAWEITRLGAMASDRLNYYTNVNNLGGFECKMSMQHVPIIPGGTLLTPSYNGQLTETLGALIESRCPAQNVGTGGNVSYADNYTRYFATMRMFVIGYYDTTVDLEITIDDNPAPGGQRQSGDPIYVNPNSEWIAEGGSVYNYFGSIQGPSVVHAKLSTYSHYQDGTIDNSHSFVVSDLGRHPGTTTDEWQIRNFILGKGPGWFTDISVNINLTFRQGDRKG